MADINSKAWVTELEAGRVREMQAMLHPDALYATSIEGIWQAEVFGHAKRVQAKYEGVGLVVVGAEQDYMDDEPYTYVRFRLPVQSPDDETTVDGDSEMFCPHVSGDEPPCDDCTRKLVEMGVLEPEYGPDDDDLPHSPQQALTELGFLDSGRAGIVQEHLDALEAFVARIAAFEASGKSPGEIIKLRKEARALIGWQEPAKAE